LVLAVILAALLAIGYARGSFREKSPTITVSGVITWQGDLGVKTLEVTAQQFPMPVLWSGKTVVKREVAEALRAFSDRQRLTLPYRLDLPMKQGAEQVIKVTAPPGWKVTPSEYELFKNTDKVNFKLEKVGAGGK
jgi:hypothetical protein